MERLEGDGDLPIAYTKNHIGIYRRDIPLMIEAHTFGRPLYYYATPDEITDEATAEERAVLNLEKLLRSL